MATAEWDIPFELVTPYAAVAGSNLMLNVDLGDGSRFALNPANCRARRSVRAVTDPIPQGDGDIFHERYATGYEVQLAIQLWQDYPGEGGGVDGSIACDEMLCEMRDLLYGHLWSLLRPAGDGGRVIWDPSCGGRRMIDACRLLALEDPIEGRLGVFEVSATIDTPFPYAIALTQDTTSISGTATVPNDGNVDFWPVIKVHAGGSACTAFTLESDILDPITGDPLTLEWSNFGSTSIPAGEYAEIDTFRGTIFLNGNEDDLSAGWDAHVSDFFPIQPGGTAVTASGSGGFSSAEFLTNDAYA